MASKKRKAEVKVSIGSLVDPSALKLKPRKNRGSRYDDIVAQLIANEGKAYVFVVPEGKKSEVWRNMVYTGMVKALEKEGINNKRPEIHLMEDGNLAIFLKDGQVKKRPRKQKKSA